MPKPTEIATITVNGQEFSDWETVRVEVQYHTAARLAQFTVSEEVSKGLSFQTLQIKPGDSCEVRLAGKKVMSGKVFARQAAGDASSHSVMIEAIDFTHELVKGSIPLNKNNEYKNYNFEQIARALDQPFGINLMMVNVPSGADKPFKSMNSWPGETAYEAIDRLAKMRGMYIRSDADGNLVAGGGSTSTSGDFVEGQNILSFNCVIRDDQEFSTHEVVGHSKGDDQTTGADPATPKAKATGSYQGYRPHLIVAEEPGDSDDMARRADHEQSWLAGKKLQCTITTTGWLNGSDLWDIEPCYKVTSPMMLLDNATLGPESISFTQDNSSGTLTTLTLVLPEGRGSNAGRVNEGAGGDSLLSSPISPAQPESFSL